MIRHTKYLHLFDINTLRLLGLQIIISFSYIQRPKRILFPNSSKLHIIEITHSFLISCLFKHCALTLVEKIYNYILLKYNNINKYILLKAPCGSRNRIKPLPIPPWVS